MTIEDITDSIQDKIEELIWEKWEGLTPGAIGDILLAWVYIRFLFDTYLCFRQLRVHYLHQAVPRQLRGYISRETFEKARIYRRDRTFFKMATYIYFMMITTIYIKWGALFKLWMASGPVVDFFRIRLIDSDREIIQTMVFVVIGTVFFNLAEIPLEVVSIFVIEEKHGFNNQSFKHFLKAFAMRNAVEIVVGVPSAAAIVKIVQVGGQFLVIWLWLFSFLWLMFFMTIYPMFIAPLFDKYKPLREGRLRQRLTSLATKCGFPLDDVLIVKESKISNHSGAYFFGFWTSKRIVLFDNLLISYPNEDVFASDSDTESTTTTSSVNPSERVSLYSDAVQSRGVSVRTVDDHGCSEEEIEAIVAHEIGHWKLNHIVMDVILAQANLILFFVVFSYVYQKSVLYEAFGSPKRLRKPIFLGLHIVVNCILDVYNFVWFKIQVMNYLLKVLSRHFEYEADAFACKLGYGNELKDAIIKMNIDNLKYPYFDRFYSSFVHQHPPVLERLKAIDEQLKKKK